MAIPNSANTKAGERLVKNQPTPVTALSQPCCIRSNRLGEAEDVAVAAVKSSIAVDLLGEHRHRYTYFTTNGR